MQSVKRLMQTIGLMVGLVFAGVVLAQSAEDAAAQKAQPADGAPKEKKADAAKTERSFISTGLDDKSVARMRPEQTVWLEAGPGGQTLALLDPAEETPAKGAIVVLADEGQTADSALAGALRKPLAAAGWGTLSLGLHEPPYALLKARQKGASGPTMPDSPTTGDAAKQDAKPATPEASAESDSIMIDVMAHKDLDQMRQDYQESLKGQLNAAIGHMRGQGFERVVLVGIGRGAGPAARQALLSGGAGQGEPQLLVWIAPTLDKNDLEAVAKADASELRVLDLRSQQVSKDTLSGQKAMLRRSGFKGYQQQQVAMDKRPLDSAAAPVSSRISAWLERQLNPETDQ